MFSGYPNKKIFEMAEGETACGIETDFARIPGRENVKNVVLDMSDPFKKFAKNMFPNTRIIADHSHVLRFLQSCFKQSTHRSYW